MHPLILAPVAFVAGAIAAHCAADITGQLNENWVRRLFGDDAYPLRRPRWPRLPAFLEMTPSRRVANRGKIVTDFDNEDEPTVAVEAERVNSGFDLAGVEVSPYNHSNECSQAVGHDKVSPSNSSKLSDDSLDSLSASLIVPHDDKVFSAHGEVPVAGLDAATVGLGGGVVMAPPSVPA